MPLLGLKIHKYSLSEQFKGLMLPFFCDTIRKGYLCLRFHLQVVFLILQALPSVPNFMFSVYLFRDEVFISLLRNSFLTVIPFL